ncbi:hypothetical protein FGG08_005618 [Glutinoglossum americanum]|uniref:COP9 signalosome complex subunit 6 n=1 Tax=Glutinoglossum americanum TaxID=1670608 RepID=A0A9P8L187_9PEZI|nr:hypothetical protein FGG08_005618 [Glutinoglossum americanum]
MSLPKPTNPLISAHKSSDSGLQILLHPLVLLNISDYTTRHTLREQEGPIVGALLGQQNGRDISLEHAFECKVIVKDGEIILHEAWLEERLQQLKDVHKAPALDLVGWYTHTPPSGPQPHHLPIHRQLLENNESAVLLAFHPSLVATSSATAGKLPLTIYESVYEAETSESGGKPVDAETTDTDLKLRFKELPYSIETHQMEMIGMDFIAKGGGNATAVKSTTKEKVGSESVTEKGKGTATRKGKEKATEYELTEEAATNGKTREDDNNVLGPEDEDRTLYPISHRHYPTSPDTNPHTVVASLTAKANAIKMLHSRIRLLNTYLSSLPPSHLTDTGIDPTIRTTEVNHTILRSIQALTNRLPLIIPADRAAFEKEMLAEENDVSLVALLGSLTRSVRDIREVGRKFSVCPRPRPLINPHELTLAFPILQVIDSQRGSAGRGSGGLAADLFPSFGHGGGVITSPTGESGGGPRARMFLGGGGT